MASSKLPIGMTFPLRQGTSGYFEQSFDELQQYKTNLTNLMKTKKGERVMQPLFGSSLYDVLFSQNSLIESGDSDFLRRIIINDINTWIPQIKVDSINFNQTNLNVDIYTIEIVISFSLKRTGESDTLTITIN
jgi:phage baseplate assembly protein W